jgi:hypothetical protein
MKLLLLSKLLQCAVIINQNTEKGSCQKRSLLILKFQHPFQLGVSCKGRGQSCSWLPQQFGYRNGIFDTGKTTIFSNCETNEQHCNWNSSSKLNNSSFKRHFSTPIFIALGPLKSSNGK